MSDSERNEPPGGVKRQKRSKFGRSGLRSVTRTTKRNIPEKYTKKDINNKDEESEEVEDDDEEKEDADDDEGTKKSTIASKRSHKGENKMAYSALVTLLKSNEELNELNENFEEDHKEMGEQSESEDGIEEEETTEVFEDAQEELLDNEEKKQDDIDILNKFDSFNLHFNQEEEISKIIQKYESLPVREKKLRLFEKQEIKVDDESDIKKYIKFNYGYPQVNENILEKDKSGTTLKGKLKYHNTKKRVADKFNNLKNVDELDVNMIESMLTYESVNFQYLNNENIKEKYQDYYILHIMNHLLKTRDRVLNNNEKKHLYETKLKEGIKVGDEPEFRDQGYTRPKVLILLPSRNFAYKVVNKIIKIFEMENIENKKKFKQQFYDDSKISDRVYQARSKDFEEFFDGNSNDMFVLGMKYTRKTLKLYSPLEQSDIIIASPIGLLKLFNKINNKFSSSRKSGKDDKHNGEQGMKNNFLSSIEICILDKSEGMMMQNWSNVNSVLNKHLNKTPKDFINVDFSRIRMWAINGQNGYITQVLNFSKYCTPEMISLFKKSKNLLSGLTSYIPVESMSVIDSTNYKLYQLGLINKFEKLKQVFTRFDIDLSSITNEPDRRFEFFKNVILPQVTNKSSYKYGTLIYIPSYFDYLRVKKYLKDETRISFVAIDEYSSTSKLTRNRALFQNNSTSATLMLYTERLHFYKRFDIKGVRNVIFYQLPSDPDFYQQVLEFIGYEKLRIASEKNKLKLKKGGEIEDEDDEAEDDIDDVNLNLCMVRSIYSKLDAMRYGPIVGSENVDKLNKGESEITEFS